MSTKFYLIAVLELDQHPDLSFISGQCLYNFSGFYKTRRRIKEHNKMITAGWFATFDDGNMGSWHLPMVFSIWEKKKLMKKLKELEELNYIVNGKPKYRFKVVTMEEGNDWYAKNFDENKNPIL